MTAEPVDGDDLANLKLGPTLRALRKEQGYTLEEVARGTKLSVSFLSMLENNKSDISISRLQRIANFYGVSVSDLFEPDRSDVQRVVRFDQAMRVAVAGEGIHMVRLAEDPQRTMDPFYTVMEPKAHYREPASHPGEEFRHVLEGSIRVRLGDDEVYDLAPGDTIYHPSDLLHFYENVGDTIARMIGCSKHIPHRTGTGS